MSENTGNRVITLSSYPRAIVHIDGDAFFTSCEQARDPSLKGRPVVTGKERGIIACASYEAKALGVARGIQLSEAKKLCPDLVILPNDYETYSLYSERMFEIIRRFTPLVEEFSIDEAFCDLTGLRRVYRTAYPEIAKKIKHEVQKELDLTVSVGVSSSKTLAKICSRYDKPDGFTPLPGYELQDFLANIPLEMVCGFGPNTVELLNKHGIRNVLGFIKRPLGFAEKLLGKVGRELWHELRGKAVYKVSGERKDKYLSISKSKTFMPPSDNKDFVKAQLMRNLESAFMKLRRHKLSAGTLGVYVKKQNFEMAGLEARLNRHSSATLDFVDICVQLFNWVFKHGSKYRATGVVLSDIVPKGVDDRTLFDDPLKIKEVAELSETMDRINKIYGKYAVHLAATNAAITRKKRHPRNDLDWRKRELLKGETPRRRLNIPLLKNRDSALFPRSIILRKRG